MELRNLLNDPTVEEPPTSHKLRTLRETETTFPLMDTKQTTTQQVQLTGSSPQKYNYNSNQFGSEYGNGNRTKQTLPPQTQSSSSSTSPLLHFAQATSSQFKSNFGSIQAEQVTQEWKNTNNGEIKPSQPLQGVFAALKIIERYKNGLIKNEVPLKDYNTLSDEFPEHPVLLMPDIYESPSSSWNSSWKPELLEKAYPEIYIRDQKNSKDIKRRISDFRYHAENLQSSQEDEIWFARDIPIMHTISCMNSKKNKNCMGCSVYWKCVQTIHDDIRPWGNLDLLHFEPGHSETFLGHISMNGSFSPTQREMLSCDSANTLFCSDDSFGVAIWGFVSPMDLTKITEEDSLGIQFYDHKSFFDPSFFERKVKVTYAIQRSGQTIIIPSGWIHWSVKVGKGLSFSASWNFLRLKHTASARMNVEFNRSIGIYKPINIASLIISSAYQKLDEFDTVETMEEKRPIIEFLFKILPILKSLVLEELLGEPITLSGIVVLSYDHIVDKFRKSGRGRFSGNMNNELLQIRNYSFPMVENDVIDDDEDSQYSCYQCRYILFNSRRSCMYCKGYHLCESCYSTCGKSHPHKMKKYRRIAISNLLELVDSISNVTQEQQDILESSVREHDTSPTKVEKESKEREYKDKDYKDKDYKDKDYKEVKEPREPKRRRREKDSSPPLTVAQSNQQSSEPYESEVIDCICGNNKDLGFMISCERCLAWLHGKCVGISKRNEPDQYYCPRCVKKSVALNAAAKLTPKSYSPERKLKEYKLA